MIWLIIWNLIQSLWTKEDFDLILQITKNFDLTWPKTSIYSYFDLRWSWKVWIKRNFALTVFKLTVQFNIE